MLQPTQEDLMGFIESNLINTDLEEWQSDDIQLEVKKQFISSSERVLVIIKGPFP